MEVRIRSAPVAVLVLTFLPCVALADALVLRADGLRLVVHPAPYGYAMFTLDSEEPLLVQDGLVITRAGVPREIDAARVVAREPGQLHLEADLPGSEVP